MVTWIANQLASLSGNDAVEKFDISRLSYPPQYILETSKHDIINVKPFTSKEVLKILEYCLDNKIPVTPIGNLTSMRGQAIPVEGGITLDTSNLSGVKEIDHDNLTVSVLPGTTYAELTRVLTEEGYKVRILPLKGINATIGGFVAEGGLGIGTLKHGSVASEILHMNFVCPYIDINRIYNYLFVHPKVSYYYQTEKDPIISTGGGKVSTYGSGYNLKELLLGSEGTLGVITQITLAIKLIHASPTYVLYRYQSELDASEAYTEVMSSRRLPYFVSIFDDAYLKQLQAAELFSAQSYYLLVVIDEDDSELNKNRAEFYDSMLTKKGEKLEPHLAEVAWKILSVGSNFTQQESNHSIVEEIKTPNNKISEAIAIKANICKDTSLNIASMVCSISNAENLFCFSTKVNRSDEVSMKAFNGLSSRLRIELSGLGAFPYGIGLVNIGLLEQVFPSQTRIMRSIKERVDPHGILNPRKLFSQERLRMGI
ncbi:MAG: FAD-binding oxidoreductase [Candidatus Bathyarchaeota archaeon]